MNSQAPQSNDSIPLANSSAALERLDGDHEIYFELIQTFLMQATAHLEWMNLPTPPCDEASRLLLTHQVHHLKGAAMTVGADRLAMRCANIEALLRSGHCDSAWAELPELPYLYHLTVEALKKTIGNL